MKKLLSLFGALGLLAFVAMPIYAQEEQEATLDEQIVAEAEDIVADAEDAVEDVAVEIADAEEAVEDVVEDTADEMSDALDETGEAIDEATDLEWIEDFNSLFENEEVKAALDEAGLTNEEAAWLIWLFAGLGMMLIPLAIVGIILRILRIIALWKAFERAGEPWWKALVPVYCTYIQYKLSGIKNWFWYGLLIAVLAWIIAACIPDQQELITNIGSAITWIIYIVMLFKFARKYSWGTFASVLFVLFYPICILVLGFGNYPYEWKKSEETIVEA